jgi:hypothetical protein
MIAGRWFLLVGALSIFWVGCQGNSDRSNRDRQPTTTDGRAAIGAFEDLGPAANDLDLSLVSSDAFAAVVLFPQQLLSREWAQDEKVQVGLTAVVERFGFNPADCVSLLLVVSPPQTPETIPFVGRMTFEKPINFQEMASEFGDALSLIEEEGGSYYVTQDGRMAYQPQGERVVLFGDLGQLRRHTQGAAPSGALARRLRALELSGDAVVVMDFDPIRPLLSQAASQANQQLSGASETGDFSPQQLVENLKSLVIRVDSTSKEGVTAELDLGDAALASQIASTSKKRISQFKLLGPLALSAALNDQPEEVNQAASTMLVGILKGLKISAEATKVMAKVSFPADSTNQLQVLLMHADKLRLQQERKEKLAKVGEALVQTLDQGIEGVHPEDHADWFDGQGNLKLSWRVHLLPALGEAELYAQFRLDEPWDSEHNLKLVDAIPEVFQSTAGSTATSFLALAGEGMAVSKGLPCRREDIQDDPALTVLLMDAGDRHAVPWSQPADLTTLDVESLAEINQEVQGPVHVVTAAGEVRAMKRGCSPDQLKAILSIAGGDEVTDSVFEPLMPLGGFGPGTATAPF